MLLTLYSTLLIIFTKNKNMLHLHSTLRYVILVLILIAIVKSLIGWLGKKQYTKGDNQISLFLMISVHLQLVVGLVLYFTRGWASAFSEGMGIVMKNASIREWSVEHLVAMLLAIILITVGRSKAKKGKDDVAKFKTQAIYYLLSLIIILYAMPWNRGWF